MYNALRRTPNAGVAPLASSQGRVYVAVCAGFHLSPPRASCRQTQAPAWPVRGVRSDRLPGHCRPTCRTSSVGPTLQIHCPRLLRPSVVGPAPSQFYYQYPLSYLQGPRSLLASIPTVLLSGQPVLCTSSTTQSYHQEHPPPPNSQDLLPQSYVRDPLSPPYSEDPLL